MPKKVPLKVQKPSGFNLSFQNILTSKPGTITPLLCHELIPNSKVDLKATIQASLPPLAFDTFMRCALKVQAFFVPMRILVGSFEDFFTNQFRDADGTTYYPILPLIQADELTAGHVFDPGTLADYLGFKSDFVAPESFQLSMMPFLAYHRIYEDWFRNTKLQRSIYEYDAQSSAFSSIGVSHLPYIFPNILEGNYVYDMQFSYPDSFLFADGHNLFDLRQCNFEDDYFTIATPNVSDKDVVISTPSDKFSIGALRGGNALQIYADRHNIAGPRYVDRLRSDYNAHLSEGVAQRCILLGSQEFEVYSKGIYSQSPAAQGSQVNNPFDSVGARYGDAYAAGNGSLAHFTAEEPGYLMVVCELVPRVTYGTGVDRKFLRYLGEGSITDMANPILQGIGNQPIFERELNGNLGSESVFGYTERFADWKTKCDELHGLVRDGQSLQAMVLQRTFAGTDDPRIGNDFIQIPTDYLDQITAVTAAVSNYGYWLDSFFDFKVVMPLAPYSIPTLEDVSSEHNDTVLVRPGGQRIP